MNNSTVNIIIVHFCNIILVFNNHGACLKDTKETFPPKSCLNCSNWGRNGFKNILQYFLLGENIPFKDTQVHN